MYSPTENEENRGSRIMRSSLATGCWPGRQRGRSMSRWRHIVETGSEAHPAFYPVGTGVSFPGKEAWGREADHSPLTTEEDVGYISTPPYVFMALCLVKPKSKSHYDWRSVSQYVLVSSPIWDFWLQIFFFFSKLLSCLCGAPCLTRGRVCHLSVFCQYSLK
jgi:hypothetical protein